MSIEYYVYSTRDAPISRKALQDKLHAQGRDILLLADWESITLAPDGPLGDDIVLGGPPTFFNPSRVRDLITSRNKVEIERLAAEGDLASCRIFVSHPFNDIRDMTPEEQDDMEMAVGKDKMDVIRQANVHYTIRISAGGSTLNAGLQKAIWQAVGELSSGLLEDPQSDFVGYLKDLEAASGETPSLPANSASVSLPPSSRPRPLAFHLVLLMAGVIAAILALVILDDRGFRILFALVGFVLLNTALRGLFRRLENRRPAVAEDSPELDSIDRLLAFGRVVENRGIPVAWKGKAWDIPTRDLTPGQIETLCAHASEYFHDDLGLATKICTDILTEYRAEKGRDFFEANKDWFESMRRKYAARAPDSHHGD